jgi:hypothetical protein
MYITAYKKNKPVIFISCTEDWLIKISDLLFDHGYLIGQCAKWYYEKCLTGDDLSEFIFYELNEEVEETDLIIHLTAQDPPNPLIRNANQPPI